MPDLLPNEKVGGICLDGSEPSVQCFLFSPLVEETNSLLKCGRRLSQRLHSGPFRMLRPGPIQNLFDRLNGLGLT
ncbi:MAG: hypothetical protein ACREUU_11500, partial [Gammaproteobacteria bacterium]